MNDNPENNLMREVDTIKSCQDKMRKTLEAVNHQLGVNRNSRHQLERDLANKDQAISIGKVAPPINLSLFKDIKAYGRLLS